MKTTIGESIIKIQMKFSQFIFVIEIQEGESQSYIRVTLLHDITSTTQFPWQ